MTNEALEKLYEEYGRVDMPEITRIDNSEEYLKNNGAITLAEFIERVGKL